MEHSAIIWEKIQAAKQSKSDLHVVWLDLANPYRSVPHQLIHFALDFFHIPPHIQGLVATYFNHFHVCYTTQEISTGWHRLEKGTAMGCSISPILFTTAFEIILISGRQMARGIRSHSGHRLPAIRSYMDDVITVLQTSACTTRLLKRLEELLTWAWMRIKPAKSRSLSIRKGIQTDNICFTVGSEKILLLVDQPVRSLGPHQGVKSHSSSMKQRSLLSPGGEWNMSADLDWQLRFPQVIAATTLRPDIVLWPVPTRSVIMVELTVPWEERIDAAFERKKERYSDLAAECRPAGWKATVFPAEVGCRGFAGTSTLRLMTSLGITGSKLRKALKDLAEEAEQGSFWLWLRLQRKDRAWGKQGT